jgi:hypothetical protein
VNHIQAQCLWKALDQSTLRAGQKKTQIKYEQSRWKIGIARSGGVEAAEGESEAFGIEGKAGNAEIAADTACHSL